MSQEVVSFCLDQVVLASVQARESSALRETLKAEREASSAEVEALKAMIQKLESQKQEHQPLPVISDKELEDRKRAEEKAAQEILQLKQVRWLHNPRNTSVLYVVLNNSEFK